jgi:hypothetical protein
MSHFARTYFLAGAGCRFECKTVPERGQLGGWKTTSTNSTVDRKKCVFGRFLRVFAGN